MQAPFSNLARALCRKFGNYAMTRAIRENISIEEAHDKYISEGIDPWTARRLTR
jgi:hypothetical protein